MVTEEKGMAQKQKFSIFDPVITHKHREFYEQIVNELNVILPVCNHGKSLAVDIGRTAKEQDTIKDLMNRVETFRDELLIGTKNLFGQFYLAKEEFYQMILSTVAYGKINTIDRNLLERTCDVRWWALETAFVECLAISGKVEEQLKLLDEIFDKILAEPSALTGNSTKTTKEKGLKQLEEFKTKYTSSLKIIYDSEFFESARQDAELVTGFLNQIKDNNAIDLLQRTLESCHKAHDSIEFSCNRLEGINRSYTLYRDLVICDDAGNVIANSNRKTRDRVIGLNVADEEWFIKAMQTCDGNAYYAQDLKMSKVEGDRESLIYTTAIRQNGDMTGKAIGVLGIFFDFQGEAEIILNDHMPRDKDGYVEDGWYTFLSNKEGDIIASSDEFMFKSGMRTRLPRPHRQLPPGKSFCSYAIYGNRESALFTARTDGYLDYKGLDWNSHLVTLKDTIFADQAYDLDVDDVNIDELMESRITPHINKKTYKYVQKDKRTLQLISTNGILFATELGARGQSLGPVFEQITRTGDFATRCMEELLHEMALEELALNFRTLNIFSQQAINLIDRNLFERAADIRWWATDRYFWEALMKPSKEASQKACERLKVINNSYTMYRNLILANSKGEIIACSNSAQLQRLKGVNVADNEWFMKGMQTLSSNEYAVQDVQFSELEKNKGTSLIYAGGIRNNGSREGDAIGVLGVAFDWDTEAQKMLKCCLPKNRDGNYIEGSAAFITNVANEIIETTNPETFPVGKVVELPRKCIKLEDGEAASGFLEHESGKFIIGSCRTQGYREYQGLSWSAHVVRPF